MVAVAAGAMVAGLAMQTYSTIKGAQAQASAANAEALARREQAAEILRRSRVNQKAAERDAADFKGRQVSGYAKAGVDVSSGSALLMQEETAARFREDIINERLESENNARLAILGAQNLEAGARNIKQAGAIGAAGTILTGAFNIANSAGAFKFSPSESGGTKYVNQFSGSHGAADIRGR